MGKGNNNRGNKEAKKPKKEKVKVSATAGQDTSNPAIVIAGKKTKKA